MERYRSTAWVIAYASILVALGLGHLILHAVNLETAALASCVIGFAGGILWRAAYPRPLAQRLAGLARLWGFMICLIGLASVVRALGGSLGTFSVNTDPIGLFAGISMLAALVLGEVHAMGVSPSDPTPQSPIAPDEAVVEAAATRPYPGHTSQVPRPPS